MLRETYILTYLAALYTSTTIYVSGLATQVARRQPEIHEMRRCCWWVDGTETKFCLVLAQLGKSGLKLKAASGRKRVGPQLFRPRYTRFTSCKETQLMISIVSRTKIWTLQACVECLHVRRSVWMPTLRRGRGGSETPSFVVHLVRAVVSAKPACFS
jgi:hypothetical protein